MGSAPSTEIQTILDKLKSHGVSDNDIQSFVSFIKDNAIDYNWIINDVSDRSKSKLFSYFKDELKNDVLFDTLCSVIKKKTTSNKISNETNKSYISKRKSKRKNYSRLMSLHSAVTSNRRERLCAMPRPCSAEPIYAMRHAPEYISMNDCCASFDSDTIGLSMGGSRDTNNFRKCIDNDIMPSINSITYTGLLYEYYFDITSRKHKENEMRENDLFYPSYCYAKILNINNSEKEYYLSVGLNSNIKQNEFKRKHLNLIILLDISGSMTASFDGDNKSFDVDINGEWRKRLKVNDTIDAKDNNNWYHAQVIQVNDDKAKIHYIGWESKYDEYISVNSNRLSPFNSSNTKMNSAKQAVLSILKQLTAKDRLAIITFNKNAEIIQNLEFVHDLDLNKLKERIENISSSGGTNFEIGYNKSIQVYSELFNDNEYKLNDDNNYDNRIIALTDAQFRDATLPLIEKDNNIYTTFIGVGLDFNSSLIEKISMVRGCNYYSVKTTKEFDDKMNQEFEFMVTPLVFNVCLKIKSEGNSLFIDKVFGSNNDDIMNKGEIARIHTLFPSKKRRSNSNEETKGGIQLIKLKKKGNDINDINDNIELLVSFEDRNGKKYENIQSVRLAASKEKENNDMIEIDEKEFNFYDNKGIRKAILLCHYVDLMKQWIKGDGANNYNLKMNDEYKKIFKHFKQHFKVEMSECGDDTLQKEVDLMDKLLNLPN